MTYAQIYKALLEEARKEISVYHQRLGGNIDGYFDVDYDIIVIRSELNGTRDGVQVLAHELSHVRDKRMGKYKNFFKSSKRKYNEVLMAEVIAAEQSAGIGASKICARYGKKYEPEELDKKKLPKLIEFWKTFYFK